MKKLLPVAVALSSFVIPTFPKALPHSPAVPGSAFIMPHPPAAHELAFLMPHPPMETTLI